MLRSLFGIDWHKSSPHLLFLSKFLHTHTIEDFAKADNWKVVLKESPQQAIKRFVDDGVLVHADLGDHLAYKFKVSELKDLLKQRSLPISGRKEDLITRFIESDLNGAKKFVVGIHVIHCSDQGRSIAEQYLNGEREKRLKVEQQVIETIRKRKFKDASLLVATFESVQIFPRGMGIDWKNYNPNRDVSILKNIFSGIPKQLASVDRENLGQLNVAAAMMHLWGTNHGKEWLSSETIDGLTFDNDVALRMIVSYAMYRYEMVDYKNSGVKSVKILSANDSYVCDSCRKLARKNYKLSEVPELPYEKCTCEMGCRCWMTPHKM